MLTVRWVAEDWTELTNRIRTDREIGNRDAILELIAEEKNPDRREQAIRQRFPKDYAYIRSVIYPQLRAVNFRYNLRRKGMVKDTIHTTELDTNLYPVVWSCCKNAIRQSLVHSQRLQRP